jgi:uncharacterized repeat protein (TIGR02543 family)
VAAAPGNTLTATPIGLYTFSGWTGACTGAGTCTLPSNTGDQTLTANFAPLPTTLSASLGTKTGTINGARTWPLKFTNSGPGAANNISILYFNVVPGSLGARCTPVVARPVIPPGTNIVGAGNLTFNATVDFTGCQATDRFNVDILYGADVIGFKHFIQFNTIQ